MSRPFVAKHDDVRMGIRENPTLQTFQLLKTDKGLDSLDGRHLEKLEFFFKDSIRLEDRFMLVGDERWLHEVRGEKFFPPPMVRLYGLAYL